MGTIKIVNRSTFKGLLEEKRKIDPHIFKMTLKQVFMDYFFQDFGRCSYSSYYYKR
jgi:hypothetical protein